MENAIANLTEPNQDDVGVSFMSFVRLMFRHFSMYVSPIVICSGIVGNFLSIVVFIKRRKQDRASAQYLGLLAVVDFLNLSVFTLRDWLHLNLHILSQGRLSYDKLMPSAVGCKFQLYIWNILSYCSSWIIICFSVERLLVIWFPLKMAPIFSSSKPRRRALGIIVLVAFIMYLPDFHWTTLRALAPEHPEKQTCIWREDISRLEVTIYVVLMIVFINNGLPCILITFLNVLILIGIFHNKMESNKSNSKTDMRCVRNLLLVSSFYFAFMLPFCIAWSIYYIAEANGFHGYSPQAARELGEVALYASTLTFMNYAINPLLYTLSLDFYRAECKRLFCCMVAKR